ncbi:MAG: hypothetical protein JW902_18520 [Syntrophaceae bacterium]|nr:hypothetical protein [Syntrophaceae bacterium]
MFKEETRRWVDEMLEAGKLSDLDEKALEQITDEYAVKLEEFFYDAVRKQLAPVGKVADFEKMLIYDTQYTTKFLNQAIPGYAGFKIDVFRQAKKKITGA